MPLGQETNYKNALNLLAEIVFQEERENTQDMSWVGKAIANSIGFAIAGVAGLIGCIYIDESE